MGFRDGISGGLLKVLGLWLDIVGLLNQFFGVVADVWRTEI